MNILILDDHLLFGESIKKLIEENQIINSCIYVDNEKKFKKKLNTRLFDIILLDINLKNKSEKNGIELMKEILLDHKDIKIIILSSYNLPIYKKFAFKNGASAFVDKSVNIEELINIMFKVYEGKKTIENSYNESILTNREMEVLKEVCNGKSRKQIAKELYISERTLYNHIQNIYDNLGVNNGIEAFDKALKLGYLDPKI